MTKKAGAGTKRRASKAAGAAAPTKRAKEGGLTEAMIDSEDLLIMSHGSVVDEIPTLLQHGVYKRSTVTKNGVKRSIIRPSAAALAKYLISLGELEAVADLEEVEALYDGKWHQLTTNAKGQYVWKAVRDDGSAGAASSTKAEAGSVKTGGKKKKTTKKSTKKTGKNAGKKDTKKKTTKKTTKKAGKKDTKKKKAAKTPKKDTKKKAAKKTGKITMSKLKSVIIRVDGTRLTEAEMGILLAAGVFKKSKVTRKTGKEVNIVRPSAAAILKPLGRTATEVKSGTAVVTATYNRKEHKLVIFKTKAGEQSAKWALVATKADKKKTAGGKKKKAAKKA